VTSAYELRRHLAAVHGVNLRGLTWEDLKAAHDFEHRDGSDHDHRDDD
jgi:hypothetical protein